MLRLTDHDLLFQYVDFAFGCTSVVLNGFVAYLCNSKRAKKELQQYRFFLCNIALIDAMLAVVVAFFVQAIPLTPLIAGIVVGPVCVFGSKIAGFVGFMTGQWLVVFSLMAINLCFMFRYVVIADTRLYDLFMTPRNLVANYLLGVFIATGVLVYTSFSYVDPQKMISIIDETFPEYQGQLENVAVYGFNMTTSYILLVALGLPASCGLNFLCAFFIFAKLRQLRESMSMKTYDMHRRLTIALIVQMISPMLTLAIPVLVIFFAAKTETNIGRLPGYIFVVIISAHPTLNAGITLYFVKPFRDKVHDIFICRRARKQHHRSTVAVQPLSYSLASGRRNASIN